MELHRPLKVIVLKPHADCEPLSFEFGEDLFFGNSVKTQFAPPEVHVGIINLLKSLQPFLKELHVFDEGEFWETQDISLLEEIQENCWTLLQEKLEENPSLKGPVRLKSGRIADLISQ